MQKLYVMKLGQCSIYIWAIGSYSVKSVLLKETISVQCWISVPWLSQTPYSVESVYSLEKPSLCSGKSVFIVNIQVCAVVNQCTLIYHCMVVGEQMQCSGNSVYTEKPLDYHCILQCTLFHRLGSNPHSPDETQVIWVNSWKSPSLTSLCKWNLLPIIHTCTCWETHIKEILGLPSLRTYKIL
jgi:hypothetical protein